MKKNELIEIVASKINLDKNETKEIVDAILKRIMQGLAKDKRLEIRGLGTFLVKDRAPRQGRIIATGEKVSIPARKGVVFVPGKVLKRMVK